MNQAELRRAGYVIVQRAAVVRCYDQERAEAAYRAYAAAVAEWAGELTAALVQILALSTIENA